MAYQPRKQDPLPHTRTPGGPEGLPRPWVLQEVRDLFSAALNAMDQVTHEPRRSLALCSLISRYSVCGGSRKSSRAPWRAFGLPAPSDHLGYFARRVVDMSLLAAPWCATMPLAAEPGSCSRPTSPPGRHLDVRRPCYSSVVMPIQVS